MTAVAITTVGYGDSYPQTLISRILTITCCILGTCVYSMVVVFIKGKTDLNIEEENAYNFNFKELEEYEKLKIAGTIIKYFLVFTKRNKDLMYPHLIMF